MTKDDDSGAKSGERRQPRLMDLQRFESKVDELTGEVAALRAIVVAQTEAANTSPFKGATLDQVATCMAFMIGLNQPGGVLDYQVKQRAEHALRGIKAMLTDDDSLLQDKPKRRAGPTPGGTRIDIHDGSKDRILAAHGLTPPPDNHFGQ